MTKCFVSHRWHENQHHFAMRLAGGLEEKGVEVWIDDRALLPGDHIQDAIDRAIRHECDVFLFVMSEAFWKSTNCVVELELALEKQQEHGMPIIPILFERCSIPGRFKKLGQQIYADFQNPVYFDAAVDRLTRGIDKATRFQRLLHVLEHSRVERQQMAAAKALAKLGDPAAVPRLSQLLRKESNPLKRGLCATALGGIGMKKGIEALMNAMSDADPWVRLMVRDALERQCPDGQHG